ncbi:hypothetical protein V6N13_147970 [Hibiscus sabdariffa]
MEFQHFLHHHKLSSVEFEENNMPLCIPGCMDIVAGPAYSCRECPSFVMHKSCAELPPQVQKGTFHPHPFRFNMMDVFVCGACRRLTASIINYKCMYCEFKLDFKCAMSVFCNDENEIAKHDEKARQGTTIRHFCHLHQLNRCVFSSWMILSEIQIFEWIWGSSKLKCVACKHEIQGTLYICISCQFVIHESCMNELPRQIQRSPFHPHHFLLPRPFLQESDASRQVPCYACNEKVQGFSFYCNECDANFHHSCAKYLTRAVLESTTKMLFDPQRKEESSDNQCPKMEGRVHQETNMLEEVQSSSFHPQHPLRTFAMMNYINPICSACREIIKGPVFSCIPCSVVMHYSCSKYQFREVKHGCHADHHLLHLGKGLFGDESPQCNACDQACKNTLWGCLECRFYRHLECIPLPSVVKHKRHLHPLVLTTSVIEDDSGDYCCDACETQRNPEHDVYHCKECNYISHIDCIISELHSAVLLLRHQYEEIRESCLERWRVA